MSADDLDVLHSATAGPIVRPVSGVSRVALTGSTGFLGQEVVRQLEAAGLEVVRLKRGATTSAWRAQCEAIDAVVHLAAPTSGVDDAALGEALAATERLFDALPHRPLRFVFAGSMALFLPPSAKQPVCERSEMWRGAALEAQDRYTRMKSAQEDLVRMRCVARSFALTIIRPTNVWNRERWLQACIGPKAGPFWLVVAPQRRLRLTHVGNCARAFVDALRAPIVASIEAINIDDNADVSAWRFATGVVDRKRNRYLPLPLPGWLFDAFASAAGAVVRLVAPSRRLPGLLMSDRRASRFGGHAVDTATARRLIGWSPDLGAYRGRH